MIAPSFLPGRGHVVIEGPAAGYQSPVAFEIAAAVASGRPIFGMVPVLRPCPVIYLSDGNRPDLDDKIRSWCWARGIPSDSLRARLRVAVLKGAPLAAIATLGVLPGAVIVHDGFALSMGGLRIEDGASQRWMHDAKRLGGMGYIVITAAQTGQFGQPLDEFSSPPDAVFYAEPGQQMDLALSCEKWPRSSDKPADLKLIGRHVSGGVVFDHAEGSVIGLEDLI